MRIISSKIHHNLAKARDEMSVASREFAADCMSRNNLPCAWIHYTVGFANMRVWPIFECGQQDIFHILVRLKVTDCCGIATVTVMADKIARFTDFRAQKAVMQIWSTL